MIYWDTNKDHLEYNGQKNATGYSNAGAFFKALARCIKSNKGFRIAYTGEPDLELFEDFCQAVWMLLDGGKITHLVVEEYGDCCANAAGLNVQKSPYHRKLWSQGRKYGLVIHATSQRPQSITKDSVENAAVVWAGNMGDLAAKRVGQAISVDMKLLQALRVGEFYRWHEAETAKKIKVFTPL